MENKTRPKPKLNSRDGSRDQNLRTQCGHDYQFRITLTAARAEIGLLLFTSEYLSPFILQ